MQFVKNIFTQTLEIKQSKFIAYLIPYTQYNQTLKRLKEEHLKARHFVVAYRYLNEYDQIIEHSSDDGEPKGTSGKPSLMVLQGNQLINSAVIIVRYFGGTKLGTGGLVRAYSDAVNLVINSAELFKYLKQVEKKIVLKYSDVRVIEYECKRYDLMILDKLFQQDVHYLIKGSEESVALFCNENRAIISD